jgi:uncharacterized membrane protein
MEKTEVQHQNHLDSAAELLSGSLTDALARAGLDNHLQKWIEDVKALANPELHQLVVDLQDLKAHFGGTTSPDLQLVRKLLHRMGTHTARAAVFADGNTQPRVTKLSEALLAAAAQLGHESESAAEDLKAEASA